MLLHPSWADFRIDRWRQCEPIPFQTYESPDMMNKSFVFFLVIGSTWIMSQTEIGGSATLSLQDGGLDCQGLTRRVEVLADVSGLSGTGGEVGINGFVLSLNLNRTDVYGSSLRGRSPDLPWRLVATERNLVDQTLTLKLVGWVADPNAPNQVYQLATLFLSGTSGAVSLEVQPTNTSLGSRIANGEGPDTIPVMVPGVLTVMIPEDFNLDPLMAFSAWLSVAPEFDLIPSSGFIDILDLVKLILCGGAS